MKDIRSNIFELIACPYITGDYARSIGGGIVFLQTSECGGVATGHFWSYTITGMTITRSYDSVTGIIENIGYDNSIGTKWKITFPDIIYTKKGLSYLLFLYFI